MYQREFRRETKTRIKMVRAPCFDKHGIKRGAWSQDEDNKLRAYIQRYGHSNWRELPKLAGLSRCGKSCRLRWMNYLRPNVKHGNFTKDEEDVVVALYNKLGKKWSMIAAQLPGRSDNEIKNYWHTHLKNQAHKDQSVLQTSSSSSSSFSSSSTTTSDQNESSCAPSLSVSDANIVVAPRSCYEAGGSLWSEEFLRDEDGIMFSSDKMFSPLGLFDDDFISQDDNVIDDVLLWSNMDLYY
ncbi:hypothetical protein OSB04_021698 [Centaurea solstitialis]|uniref:Uncharacterized protein n=1 Tax=Centaurea solstitialis TaxID=347529 RepID=A0AA38WEF0_9ASTR|nr:hypothetical protein OSB04_021698 [Centaurea solstitialis]